MPAVFISFIKFSQMAYSQIFFNISFFISRSYGHYYLQGRPIWTKLTRLPSLSLRCFISSNTLSTSINFNFKGFWVPKTVTSIFIFFTLPGIVLHLEDTQILNTDKLKPSHLRKHGSTIFSSLTLSYLHNLSNFKFPHW